MTRPTCPYCQSPSMRTTGATIYLHRIDLADKVFYWCPPCDAYVGTHAATGEPLGTLANANLRRLRNKVHAVFDPIWDQQAFKKWAAQMGKKKEKKPLAYFVPQYRTAAYAQLAGKMDIPIDLCHIAMFNEDQCRQALRLIDAGEITLR